MSLYQQDPTLGSLTVGEIDAAFADSGFRDGLPGPPDPQLAECGVDSTSTAPPSEAPTQPHSWPSNGSSSSYPSFIHPEASHFDFDFNFNVDPSGPPFNLSVPVSPLSFVPELPEVPVPDTASNASWINVLKNIDPRLLRQALSITDSSESTLQAVIIADPLGPSFAPPQASAFVPHGPPQVPISVFSSSASSVSTSSSSKARVPLGRRKGNVTQIYAEGKRMEKGCTLCVAAGDPQSRSERPLGG
ncbi:uncharacterized protein MKK02DRAFT_32097 [Dioszegia hungarica]|uniref:Uncharacterized protein n=1 Tax=Dioszegia hungarica TaxID=4972 RepID=A0AA38H9Z0_9TREE|nr:uncharacterized protein MKK02DRAFT_32097 [Dioszegia hungarica]KAI9637202.1 hypothetical protein MKK02DRAFT_32097 [Dioszegia hungarica]